MSDTFLITVTFNNGSIRRFESPSPPTGLLSNRASNMETLLHSNVLALEADGKLIVIPTSAILTIDVVPAPTPLAPSVVRGLREIT